MVGKKTRTEDERWREVDPHREVDRKKEILETQKMQEVDRRKIGKSRHGREA